MRYYTVLLVAVCSKYCTHCKPNDAKGNFDPSAKVAMGLIAVSAASATGVLGSMRPEAVVVPNAAAATPAC